MRLSDDPELALWELGRHVPEYEQWEIARLLTVTRRPDVQEWLLALPRSSRDYGFLLGLPCALGGGLAERLAAPEITYEFLANALRIVDCMIQGTDYKEDGLDVYAPAPQALADLLRHCNSHPLKFEDYRIVKLIIGTLAVIRNPEEEWKVVWDMSTIPELSSGYKALLNTPCSLHVAETALSNLDSYSRWDKYSILSLADSLGLDTFQQRIKLLEAKDYGQWNSLLTNGDDLRQADALDYAMNRLPELLTPEPEAVEDSRIEWRVDGMSELRILCQALVYQPLLGNKLLLACLNSGNPRAEEIALRAVLQRGSKAADYRFHRELRRALRRPLPFRLWLTVLFTLLAWGLEGDL